MIMKARWKILLVLGIFFTLVAASLLVTAHFQPENELEAYKKTLREKGEKLELDEVMPRPVPSESNSVEAVEEAFRIFGSGDPKLPEVMKMVAPGKALIGWRQPEVRGYNFTNSWDEFAAEAAANLPAIELLQEVLERPKLDFQLDYKKVAALLLPHLGPMKRATQILEAEAVLELHNRNTGAAMTNIVTLLALIHNNTGEGLLISHLVHIAMAAIAVAPTWELLQATNATDAQLAAVQRSWEQLDFLNEAETTFAMERAWMTREIQKARASSEALDGIYGSFGAGGSSGSGSSGAWDWDAMSESARLAVGKTMWRSSWSYSDELHVLKSQQIILEAVRAMQTNQSQFFKADLDKMNSRLSSLGLTNTGQAFFRALKIPDFAEIFGGMGLNNTVQKTLRMEAARRVVVTAIALKRFQLKNGQWPETLDALTPELFRSVPIDPYDGKPLRYHPNADGTYLLYCVGEDGVDDGGDASPVSSASVAPATWSWQRARDWVWPQPATPAEVQDFYEHPPK